MARCPIRASPQLVLEIHHPVPHVGLINSSALTAAITPPSNPSDSSVEWPGHGSTGGVGHQRAKASTMG